RLRARAARPVAEVPRVRESVSVRIGRRAPVEAHLILRAIRPAGVGGGSVILACRTVTGAVARVGERLARHRDELPAVPAVLECDLQDPEGKPTHFAVRMDRDRGDLVHALAAGADVDLTDPRGVVA